LRAANAAGPFVVSLLKPCGMFMSFFSTSFDTESGEEIIESLGELDIDDGEYV
jgi:hypothetical protein